jgi:hypothetical protein
MTGAADDWYWLFFAVIMFVMLEWSAFRRRQAPSEITHPMAEFDYNASAELFGTRKRALRGQPLGYRRFTHAAQAIRFAIEELKPDLLVGAFLEVDEQRFNSDQIRQLYESAKYPLARRST